VTAATSSRALLLVEGDSDAEAIRALAHRIGCDLDALHIRVKPAHGVTNFPRLLAEFLRTNPDAKLLGMYDVADEHHVRRALARVSIAIEADAPLESLGFFACVADLEDELIRALGTQVVEQILEAQGELRSFRRFQTMPQHRAERVHDQLHRFLGTRATRKIRSARHLVEALELDRLPRPLAELAAKLLDPASWLPGDA